MNEYVERYIYDVTRRLPENQREDVSKELKSLIEDMMEEHGDVQSVLRALGHPKDLAARYREKPRYLISPEYFDRYVDTLKLVVRIVLIVFAVIAGIVIVSEVLSTSFQEMNVVDIITFFTTLIFSNLGTAVSMVVSSVVVVTLVFAILDYNGAELDDKEWSLDDLPHLEKPNAKKISKAEAVVEIVMSLFFMCVFLTMIINNINIPVIIEGESVYHVFNLVYLRPFTVFMMVTTSLQIITSVLKLTYNRYNYVIAFVTLISNCAGVILAGFMLLSGNIFDPGFIGFMESLIPEFTSYIGSGIIFAVIAIIALFDSAAAFYYASKSNGSIERHIKSWIH